MTRPPENLREAMFPFVTTYALVGHGIFRYPSGRQLPLLSIIYAVISLSMYIAALYRTLRFIQGECWWSDFEEISLAVLYVNVGIFLIGVILSWSNAKRFVRITEDLTKVDETLRELGATFDYVKTRNEGYALMFAWIIMIFGLDCLSVMWLYDAPQIGRILMSFSVLHHSAHVITIVVTHFSIDIRLVGARYKEANSILDAMRRNCSYDTIRLSSTRTRQLLRSTGNHKHFVQIIKHVHLQLCEISRDLCESYGMQVVLNAASLFVMFTGFLYLMYDIAVDSRFSGQNLRLIALGLWISFYFIYFIGINEICEKVRSEAHRTGEIIHCISQETDDVELASEISQFSLQLIQDPLDFNLGGLISLGHRFIRNFVETVTTYLVILVQLRPSKTASTPHS